MSSIQLAGTLKDNDLLALVVAILGVTPVPGKHGDSVASDLFVMKQRSSPYHADEIW